PFPYTTLFRSSGGRQERPALMALQHRAGDPRLAHELRGGRRPVCGPGLGERRVQLRAAFLRSRKSKVEESKVEEPKESRDFRLSQYAAGSPIATRCATISNHGGSTIRRSKVRREAARRATAQESHPEQAGGTLLPPAREI